MLPFTRILIDYYIYKQYYDLVEDGMSFHHSFLLYLFRILVFIWKMWNRLLCYNVVQSLSLQIWVHTLKKIKLFIRIRSREMQKKVMRNSGCMNIFLICQILTDQKKKLLPQRKSTISPCFFFFLVLLCVHENLLYMYICENPLCKNNCCYIMVQASGRGLPWVSNRLS